MPDGPRLGRTPKTGFDAGQLKDLAAPLSQSHVKNRNQAGRQVSYIESWHAEAEANRIFGFDGWSTTVLSHTMVAERDVIMGKGTPREREGYTVSYICTVRVEAGGVTRDGMGAGHGIDADLGLAHESAIKEAQSDAEKRALKTFGNVFGLALYDKTQANVEKAEEPPRARPPAKASPAKKPPAPPPRPLAARVDLLMAAMTQAKHKQQLEHVYDLGAQLRQELDQKDPEALVGLEALFRDLHAELPQAEDWSDADFT